MEDRKELKERKVEWYEQVDEKAYVEYAREGKLDLIENEISLIEESLSLPSAFMSLDEQCQQILLLYLDEGLVEPYSGQPTHNNKFASFLMTYPNKRLLSEIFVKTIERDINDDPYEVINVSPEKYSEYLKLKAFATSLWKQNALHQVVRPMRDVLKYDGFKAEEMLENAILDDALSNDKSNYTLRNRSMAIKIKGMEKQNSLQLFNVYLDKGGEQLNKRISQSSGNNAVDLIPSLNDESDEDE